MAWVPTGPKGIKRLKILVGFSLGLRICSLAFGLALVVFGLQAWTCCTYRLNDIIDELTPLIIGCIATLSTLLLTISAIFFRIHLPFRLSAMAEPKNAPLSTQRSIQRSYCYTAKSAALIWRTVGEVLNVGLWTTTGTFFAMDPTPMLAVEKELHPDLDGQAWSWQYTLFSYAGSMAMANWALSIILLLAVIWEEIWVRRVCKSHSLDTLGGDQSTSVYVGPVSDREAELSDVSLTRRSDSLTVPSKRSPQAGEYEVYDDSKSVRSFPDSPLAYASGGVRVSSLKKK